MNISTRFPPAARISPDASFSRYWSRPVIATVAPILANPTAVARPMPPLAPVITTVRPLIGRSTCRISNSFAMVELARSR